MDDSNGNPPHKDQSGTLNDMEPAMLDEGHNSLEVEENSFDEDVTNLEDRDLLESVAEATAATHTVGSVAHNPEGRNQYKNCVSKNDSRIRVWLLDYHRRNITNKITISELLLAEHGIVMSPATVTRRRHDLGITGSAATTKTLPESTKRQLVLDQMAKDPNRRRGPRLVKEAIASTAGVHLTRDYIANAMRAQDPEGFNVRHPNHSKKRRQPLAVLGPHHEWSGDGHEKLAKLGFPIYGIRDVWSTAWLGLWVVPNNRLKTTVAYLWLSLVRDLGGMCIQSTTDCGSETGLQYGFANALREHFAPHLALDELPAHRFLKSVHNTTIERGWLRLRLQWGDNVVSFWDAGADMYDPLNPDQYTLVQWLWPKVIQIELDQLRHKFNNHKSRKNKDRILPSGVAPQVALSTHEKLGATNCLIPVDVPIVQRLMDEVGGEELVRFVSRAHEAHAQQVFNDLGLVDTDLRLDNAWAVFRTMIPNVHFVQ